MLSLDEPRLPQEIFDNIIDHLHADIYVLENCAFVAPAWLSSARAHLFHRVSLDPPKNVKKAGTASAFKFIRTRLSPCQKLFEIIETSRKSRLGSIAPYVRELHLCEGMLAREWLAREPMISLVVKALPNLRRFEISRSASVHIAWNQLPVTLKTSIEEHVLRLPSLTELKLSCLKLNNVGEIKKMLRACKHLRVLEVDHLVFEDNSVEFLEEGGQGEVAPLDTLIIGPRTSTVLVSYLLHPFSTVTVNTVRRLSISISDHFADFARLLHASLSVEHLEVVLMNDINLLEYWKLVPSQQFDLNQIPNLRHVRVNIDVLQKSEDPLAWVYAFLYTGIDSARPTRSNSVESVSIGYSLYLPAPYMDRSVNTTIFDKWTEIDAILCGAEPGKDFEPGKTAKYSYAYDNLRSVKLEFMLENPIGYGVAPRFLKEVVLDSPGLEKRDVLRIDAFDTSK